MRVSGHDVTELRDYLVRIGELLPRLDLDAVVGGGATTGQLAFHAAESADGWVRRHILGDERSRDRDAELSGWHSREDIAASLELALDACDELGRRQPELDAARTPIPDQPPMTVLQCLVHATAHTAEHVGHLEATLQ